MTMKSDDKKTVITVDDYIAGQPENYRKSLQELCSLIKSEVPQVTEIISYGIPIFKYLYDLVGIGAAKKHIGFYTMIGDLEEKYKDELNGVKAVGTTLHLPVEGPFPEKLLIKIIKQRVKENEARAAAKKNKLKIPE